MSLFYTKQELEMLSQKLRIKLQYLFISTGIFSDIFINTVILSKYAPNKDIYRTLVIDVLVAKNSDYSRVKPILNSFDFDSSGLLINYNLSNIKSKWYDKEQKGGRLICLVYKDGTVRRISSTDVLYADTIDECSEDVGKIMKIITEHFIHPYTYTVQKNDKIKLELIERIMKNSENHIFD